MPVRAAPKWIVRSAWVLAFVRRWRYRQYRHATLVELIANVRGAGLFARK